MRPIYINVTLSPTGPLYVSPAIVVDQYVAPGNILATLTLKTTGVAPLKLEYTTDDIFDSSPNPVIVWQPYANTPFNTSGQVTLTSSGGTPAAAPATFAYAPRALRVSTTAAVTGTPLLSIQVIQLGVASV